MQNNLLVITTKEDRQKKQLQQSIARKRKVLEAWMEKGAILKMELDLIKNEYTVRIGYLFLKDNQLDLEIIQYKNLKRLMDEGKTYEEAVKEEEDKFYNEILRIQKEQEKIEEEKSFFEKRQEVSEEVQEDIKTIWKKLIRKFHPDLVTDPGEKGKREALMKQVNKAYTEADLDTLRQLENQSATEDTTASSIEALEKVLVDTENLILGAKQNFKDLRESEWYIWKKKIDKAKKVQEDVFAQLERKLLDDIVGKIEVLRELRKTVHPTEKTADE